MLRAVVIEKKDWLLEGYAAPLDSTSLYSNNQLKMWRTAFRKMVGKKVCLSGYGDDDTTARYLGFTILGGINSGWESFLSRILEIPYSYAIAREAAKKKHVKKAIRLLPDEKKILKEYRGIFKSFYADCDTIKVDEDLYDDYENKCNGIYDPNTKILWLDRSVLKSEEILFKKLLHETIHFKTGARDNTTEFTRGWEDACWRLYCHFARHSHDSLKQAA